MALCEPLGREGCDGLGARADWQELHRGSRRNSSNSRRSSLTSSSNEASLWQCARRDRGAQAACHAFHRQASRSGTLPPSFGGRTYSVPSRLEDLERREMRNVPFSIVVDDDAQSFAERWFPEERVGFPSTFVIDEGGVLRAKIEGWTDAAVKQIARAVDALPPTRAAP